MTLTRHHPFLGFTMALILLTSKNELRSWFLGLPSLLSSVFLCRDKNQVCLLCEGLDKSNLSHSIFLCFFLSQSQPSKSLGNGWDCQLGNYIWGGGDSGGGGSVLSRVLKGCRVKEGEDTRELYLGFCLGGKNNMSLGSVGKALAPSSLKTINAIFVPSQYNFRGLANWPLKLYFTRYAISALVIQLEVWQF
ncbi:hypothetical protein Tco_0973043 [Tanacetum coccineum]